MNLYVESSAILALLLGETRGATVEKLLGRADNVVASEILLLECDRALIRAEGLGVISSAQAGNQRAAVSRESAFWTLIRIEGEVMERARRPFPLEPVRALDALHLATLLTAGSIFIGAELLSFDDRIRENAVALGFELAGE